MYGIIVNKHSGMEECVRVILHAVGDFIDEYVEHYDTHIRKIGS